MTGHVHVVAGDLRKIVCDAWLLPTDNKFDVTSSFAAGIGVEAGRLAGLDWIGGRVVEYPNAPRRRVFLGDVGRQQAPPAWYAAIIDPFVASAKDALGRRPDDRRVVLGVNVLGTGFGGMDASKGAVHAALLPALYDAAAAHDVDLVLVCWGRRAYSAAQRVRESIVRERGGVEELWDLGASRVKLTAAAEKLAQHARNRNLVLFMGAGLSIGAGLSGWQALLDEIGEGVLSDGERIHFQQLDLRDQAFILQKRLARQGRTIHDEVISRTIAADYSLGHAQLASLRVEEAVTTNYDQLYETAVEPVDGTLAVLPYEAVARGQRWLLKLHGTVESADSVVITRSDYLTVPERHGALFGLVQAMLLTRHMLFVGYSLSDEDFHQLVHEVRRARAGTAVTRLGTVLTLHDDPLFADLWEDDLDVVALASRDESIDVAARRLAIFLDLVAFLAADLDEFLLDESYADLLTNDERRLAELLEPLLDVGRDGAVDSVPAAGRVGRLLDELGRARRRGT